jgi:ABC-type multidrug transport system permease subunit
MQAAAAKDHTFYGIIAREEKQIYMAAIYLAIIGASIVPSMWFFFEWLNPGTTADEALVSNRKGNLSNAFVPLSLSISLFSCVLGVVIAL